MNEEITKRAHKVLNKYMYIAFLEGCKSQHRGYVDEYAALEQQGFDQMRIVLNIEEEK